MEKDRAANYKENVISEISFDSFLEQQSRLVIQTTNRVVSLLNKMNCKKIIQILDYTETDITNIRGMGKKASKEFFDFRNEFEKMIPKIEKLLVKGTTSPISDNITNQEEPASEVIIQTSIQFRSRPVYDIPLSKLNSILLEDYNNGNDIEKVRVFSERLGKTKLIEILDISQTEVFKVPQKGGKMWTIIQHVQEYIMNNLDKIENNFERKCQIQELPHFTDNNQHTIATKIETALRQTIDLLRLRSDKKTEAFLIENLLLTPKSYELVGKLKEELDGRPVTHDQIRFLLKKRILPKLMGGYSNPIAENIVWNEDFITELIEVKDDCLYRSMDYLKRKANIQKDSGESIIQSILRLFDFDVLEMGQFRTYQDQEYIILDSRNEKKASVYKHIRAFYDFLKDKAIPYPKDELILGILDTDTDNSLNEETLQRILSCHTWIEQEGGKCQLKYEHLPSNDIKIARLFYENRTTQEITDSMLRTWNEEKTGTDDSNFAVSFGNAKRKFNFIQNAGRQGVYRYQEDGKSLTSIIETIATFAKEKEVFKMDDLMCFVESKGYAAYQESSIRTYVLKFCQPANEDKNIMCYSEAISKHEEYTWRNRTRNGVTNWIINTAISILKENPSHTLKYNNLENKIIKASSETDYSIRNLGQYYLNRFYCSDDNPDNLFIYDEDKDTITLNQKALELELFDLETVGNRERQPKYYMEVMQTIKNELECRDDCTCSLKELKKMCSDVINVNGGSNTIFYRIIKKLPKEIQRVSINDIECLKLNKELLVYESYSAKEASSDKEEQPKKTKEVFTLPNRREDIDYDNLSNRLKEELCEYNRFWDLPLTIEDYIPLLMKFIRVTKQKVLTEQFTRKVDEFLNYKIDKFDLYAALQQVILSFEALLRSIYMFNSDKPTDPKTGGLQDCVNLFKEASSWVNTTYEPNTHWPKFYNIYISFKKNRNKIGHGIDIELSTKKQFNAIYDYLALFVYFFAKCINMDKIKEVSYTDR